MIIEGIVATENENGAMHLAPIGPHVDEALREWTLKPFQTSTTFANLFRTGRCVFHLVDDAFLMAASVIGLGNDKFPCPDWALDFRTLVEQSRKSDWNETYGWQLQNASAAVALQVVRWDTSADRAVAECQMTTRVDIRPFWGWNRAKHSILELSILYSRRHLLDPKELRSEWERHRVFIEKTAGDSERRALELLTAAMSR